MIVRARGKASPIDRGAVVRRLRTGMRRLRPLRPLAVPGAYALIALATFWPLPFALGRRVPYGGDALLFLWNLWWFRQAAEAGISPFETGLLYHPYGVSTVFTTLAPLASALSVPLQWAGLGLVASYNLLHLLSSVAGAWAMWALARRLTGSSGAAFVAGFVYGWSPYHTARVAAGHLNLASHQWLPVYALALIRLVDGLWPGAQEEGWQAQADATRAKSRPIVWAVVAAAAAAATAWTELTYAAFLALWTAFYLAYRGWPLLRRGAARSLARALVPLAVAAGLALALTAPLLLAILGELRRDETDYMLSHPDETLIYSADVVSYLLPSELHPLAGARLLAFGARLGGTPNLAERVVTLGCTVPLLCLVALLLRRHDRATRFWGWAIVVFGTLSIGPVLHVLGRTNWTTFRTGVLLPYAALYHLPGFAVMRAPLRFAVLVTLAGAVLAAYGLAALRARRGRAGRVVTILAALLIAAEYWVAPALVDVREYDFTAALRRDPLPGAVLNVPVTPRVDYLWQQTQHNRPITGGYLARQPPDRFAVEHPVMVYLNPETPPQADALVRGDAGPSALARAGIRYVTIHWWAVPAAEIPALEQKLATLFGERAAVDFPHEQTSYWLIADAEGGERTVEGRGPKAEGRGWRPTAR